MVSSPYVGNAYVTFKHTPTTYVLHSILLYSRDAEPFDFYAAPAPRSRLYNGFSSCSGLRLLP